MTLPLFWSLSFLACYLSGSVPYGLLLGLMKGVDIRQHGSGNVGATNTMRVLGKPIGFTCFFWDVFKGLIPVVLIHLARPEMESAFLSNTLYLIAPVCCILGHVFPVWLKFKGGKGVATAFGALLGVWPILTIAMVVSFTSWLITLKISKYVSLGSIVAAGVLPVITIVTVIYRQEEIMVASLYAGFALLIGVLVIIRHKGNIKRLREGTENKIGQKKKESGQDVTDTDESVATGN